MKKFFSITSMITAVALMFLVISNPFSASAKETKHYTGKEIFAGIFFVQGAFAKELNKDVDLEGVEGVNKSENKIIYAELIKQMDKLDPSYFEDLEKSIYNKDYIKTDELFTKGGKLLNESVEKLNAAKIDNNAIDNVQGVAVFPAISVAFTTAAAVAQLAVAVTYVFETGVAVHHSVKFWAPQENDGTKLSKEKFLTNVVKVATE